MAPMPPKPSGGSGCLVAILVAIVVGLAGGGLVAALLVLRSSPSRTSRSERSRLDAQKNTSSDGAEDPLPTHGDVPVAIHTDRYTITGTTASEMRHELDDEGPSDAEGHHDAMTDWYVKWSYPHDRSGGRCATGGVHVEVTVTYRMPDWEPRDHADAELSEKWRLYEQHLMKHEKGHAAHGIDAGEEILRELSKVPPRENCGELDQVVNDLGHSILDKYKAEDIEYDASTRHGATQGAVFP